MSQITATIFSSLLAGTALFLLITASGSTPDHNHETAQNALISQIRPH